MKIIEQRNLIEENLPGRVIKKAVGKDGPSVSQKMTVGFARYSSESGLMDPHHHAEEVVFILNARNGYSRYGNELEKLGERIELRAGMLIHFDELEWHVFEFDENGIVEIIFIYGQVDNIRPEEIIR